MTKNKRAKRDARDFKAVTNGKYTEARRLTDGVKAVDDDDEWVDEADYSEDGVNWDADDDSGYGPNSYFAHAMGKDD